MFVNTRNRISFWPCYKICFKVTYIAMVGQYFCKNSYGFQVKIKIKLTKRYKQFFKMYSAKYTILITKYLLPKLILQVVQHKRVSFVTFVSLKILNDI